MSLSDAQEFLGRLARDRDLAKKEAAAHRRELVELARENGFDVTAEELVEAAGAVLDAPYAALDDEMLESVAGGFGPPWDLWGDLNISMS